MDPASRLPWNRPPRRTGARAVVAAVAAAILVLGPARSHGAGPAGTAPTSRAERLARALDLEIGRQDPTNAIPLYRDLIDDPEDPGVASRALLRLGLCLIKVGKTGEARERLRAVVDQYPEKASLVDQAKEQLGRLRTHPPVDRTTPREPGESAGPGVDRRAPTLSSPRPSSEAYVKTRLQGLFIQRLIGERRIESSLEDFAEELENQGAAPETIRVECFYRRAELTRNVEEHFKERSTSLRSELAAAGHDPVTVERMLRRMQEAFRPCLASGFLFRDFLLGRAQAETRFRNRLMREIESRQESDPTGEKTAERVVHLLNRFYRAQAGESRYRRNARRLELKDEGRPPEVLREAMAQLDQAWSALGFDGRDPHAMVQTLFPQVALDPLPVPGTEVSADADRDAKLLRLYRENRRLQRQLTARDQRIEELSKRLESLRGKPADRNAGAKE